MSTITPTITSRHPNFVLFQNPWLRASQLYIQPWLYLRKKKIKIVSSPERYNQVFYVDFETNVHL